MAATVISPSLLPHLVPLVDRLRRVAIGESFVTEDDDAVTAFVEAETERVKRAMDDADAELTRIADRMGELKKALYGRFGKAIHLENDDDDE